MKWTDLKAGDKLYLLVPEKVENASYLTYQFQESYAIKVTVNEGYTSIRMKFTNCDGRRQRIEYVVYPHHISTNIAVTDHKYVREIADASWGDLIIECEDPANLKGVYADMIMKKKHELRSLVDSYISYIALINDDFSKAIEAVDELKKKVDDL